MEQLTLHHWLFGILGAIFVGLGKGGLPGMGNLTVALYALVLPDPKLSVGVLLPILSCSDIFAVRIYQKHGHTKLIMKLLPWTGIGLLLGAVRCLRGGCNLTFQNGCLSDQFAGSGKRTESAQTHSAWLQ